MAEIIVTVVLEVAKCLVPSTRSEISQLGKYKTNFENLKAEVEKLKGISTSIQHKVDEAKRKGEEIEDNVQKWLEKANKIISEEAAKFIEDEETEANKRCFVGLCPDLKSRHRLSKESARQLEAVVKHREAGSFDSISYCTSPEDPRLSNKNYMAFESRESTLNAILSAINDPNLHIIGIYGMGGVGKTTLAKEVAKQAERSKFFDRVVFAAVNQSPEIGKIQGEIADSLGLSLSNVETPLGRAGMLCKRLKKEKNILVILDDIWATLDLEAVGIPLGVDHEGCKVLLTARSVDLLSRKMDSQRNFEVRILIDKEAWSLFKKMAGNYIEDREFHSVATQVVKKCAGLPIAITTVGRALRNKRLFAWEDALQQLRRSSSENIEGIHATIELSYNHLENEELKKTFLLIGYSYINSVGVLLSYAMGLGLFEGINKMEEAQARVRTLVQELKDSCMLLDSNIVGEYFSMHDVVRDVAISVASRKHQVLTMRNVPNDQWKWPVGSILKSYSSVVLKNVGSNHELPEVLECPQLKFFRIYPSSNFEIYSQGFNFLKLSEDFFARMKELRVLDLNFAYSVSLPSSVRLLTNLRTLRLVASTGHVHRLAVVGNLRKLEILHLSFRISQLPVEVGQLTLLRSLDLSACTDLKVIRPNIISRLSYLEELYLAEFDEWEVEVPNNKRTNASLDELNHLSHLTSLQIQIRDANALPRDLSFFKRLERYKIQVGNWSRPWSKDYVWTEMSRIIKLSNRINAYVFFDVWHIMQLKKIDGLFLDGLLDKENSLYGLDKEGFSHLKYLQVKNNPKLSCIVEYSNTNNSATIELVQLRSLALNCVPQLTSFCSTTDTQLTLFNEKIALPNLEILELYEINAERIWQNQGAALSCGIQNLTSLIVRRCTNLRCLFSSSMATSLDRLKHLEICGCPLLEEIIVKNGLREEERKHARFPQLKFLMMEGLESLTKFTTENHIEFPSLKKLVIKKCPELKEFVVKNISTDLTEIPLFNEKVAFPILEEIVISDMDNLMTIVQQQIAAVLFCKLKSMKVERCDKLKSLILHGADGSQLERLDIRGCGEEEIVFDGDGVDQANALLLFQTVTSLTLNDLPNLPTSFAAGQPLIKVFSNLEELFVKGNSIATMIWQFSEDCLCRLKYVVVDLDESTVILSLDFLQRMHNVKVLVIDGGRHINEPPPRRTEKGMLKAMINNLNKCSDLKYIWKEECIVDNLVELQVRNCHNLINLVSSSTSFGNLTILVVRNCKGLTNIVTASTTKSFVQLKRISILDCNRITEIIGDEGDAATDHEIVFSELKELSLIRLKSLASFCCSSSYTFKFPSLQELIVDDCPKMKNFCGGELSTPNLHKVRQVFGGDVYCKGGLNTTIQQLHEDMEVQSCEEDSAQPSTQHLK